MAKRIVTLSLLVIVFNVARAQSEKEFSGPYPNRPSNLIMEEQAHQKDFYIRHKVKPFKWKRAKVTHTAQYEFYKRVEKAAKEHQRELKKLHRPQYSYFLYYGHKRKPKKHSPDKMKYCRECGIRH